MRRRRLFGLSALSLALPKPSLAQGGAWPGRMPIRLIVTFPPGGLADTVARLVTPALGSALGQQLVVENRAGAGGSIGADLCAKSAPDGYTLVVSHASPHGIAPGIYPQLPYDPVADFSHLAMLCDTANALMVKADSPIRSMADYLAAAKASGVRYGSSGIGSITHLMGEVLAKEAGLTKLEHVPYRGSAPALQDMLAGQIESLFDPLTTYVGMLKDGTLRALAVSSPQRVPGVPEVPTFAELGLARLTCTTWIGISGPKGLPAPIAARITDAVQQVMAGAELRRKLAEQASYPPATPLTGPAFSAYVADYVTEWTGVAKRAGIVAS
jgi:tripartite-type tricarboxylate transporter receptor subunit TctC